jgi:hypothetical protein
MSLEDLIDRLLNESDFSIRKYIPDKLAKLGNWESTEYLGQVMNNEKEPIALRIECAESLGKQGDPNAIKFLEVSLKHTDAELRRTSLWSVGQIGLVQTIDLIMSLVSDSHPMVRKWVLKSLGRIHSKESLENLDDIFENHFDLYSDYLNLLLNAVQSLLPKATDESIEKWSVRSYNLYENHVSTPVRQACLNLQLSIYNLGKSPDINYYRDKLRSTDVNDKILRPLIIRILGYADDLGTLNKLNLNKHLIIAFSFSSDQNKLIKILDNYKNYETDLIAAILENIQIECNCSHFLEFENLDIKHAALTYYAKLGLKHDLVSKAINEGKRVNYLLKLLKFFPDRTFKLIEDKGLYGSKPERQTIIEVLKSIDYTKFNSSLDDSIKLLKKIALKDKIWHIRRDARQLDIILEDYKATTKF